MSKTTKALAILGVVAGLGVAAMPMSAMAAELTTLTDSASVTDKVVVKTTIKDYISIELKAGGSGTFDQSDATNSSEENKYHVHTLDLGDLVNGQLVSGSLKVNVKTNHANGFKLAIAAAEAAMKGTTVPTNTIPGGVPAAGNTSAWGFKLENSESTAGLVSKYESYTAVPTSNTMISSSNVPTTDIGLDTKVTFGVSASNQQAADTYSQTVTFTAAVPASASDFASDN